MALLVLMRYLIVYMTYGIIIVKSQTICSTEQGLAGCDKEKGGETIWDCLPKK